MRLWQAFKSVFVKPRRYNVGPLPTYEVNKVTYFPEQQKSVSFPKHDLDVINQTRTINNLPQLTKFQADTIARNYSHNDEISLTNMMLGYIIADELISRNHNESYSAPVIDIPVPSSDPIPDTPSTSDSGSTSDSSSYDSGSSSDSSSSGSWDSGSSDSGSSSW